MSFTGAESVTKKIPTRSSTETLNDVAETRRAELRDGRSARRVG
jgi:hypothetical protein